MPTKHPQPEPNTPSPDTLGAFPTRPRFTLDTLREIRIATGDGDSTIAAYTHMHRGKPVTKYATFDTLTHAEREAALAFILKYTGAAAIRRKAKPRGKAVSGGRDQRRQYPKFETMPELYPLDMDTANLTPIQPPALENIPENIPFPGEDQTGKDQ